MKDSEIFKICIFPSFSLYMSRPSLEPENYREDIKSEKGKSDEAHVLTSDSQYIFAFQTGILEV